MSAAEIIEQIKGLPREEAVVIWEFLERHRDAFAKEPTSFENAADQVFAKHDRLLRELAK